MRSPLTPALAAFCILLSTLPATGQYATESMIEQDARAPLVKALQAEVQAAVEAWKRDRAAMIAALVAKGADPADAEAAIDELIAHGDRKVAEGAETIAADTPRLTRLNRRLGVLSALATIGHERLMAFGAEKGLAGADSLLNCLCQSYSIMGAAVGYHPAETADCKNADPCKGGNWGCVSHDLPGSPRVWMQCVAGATGPGGTPLTEDLLDQIAKLESDYEKDVCARLKSLDDATKAMLAAGQLKPNAQSMMATRDFEQSFADFLTGGNFSGTVEVGAGALVDKFGINLGYTDGPTGLGVLLTDSDRPSVTGDRNPYIRLTKVLSSKEVIGARGENVNMSLEMRLARRIVKAPGTLNPGDVLRMAVEVTGGDVPLAALVAHNLLKEATYADRQRTQMVLGWIPHALQSNDPATQAYFGEIKKSYRGAFEPSGATFAATDFLMPPEALIAKLQDIRPPYDPHFPDRMGPWYHSFGLVFVGTNPTFGALAAQGGAALENVTRLLGAGSVRSLGKEAANRCAARISSEMVTQMGALK